MLALEPLVDKESMMKKLASVAAIALLPFTASADFIGFAVGAAYWNPDPSGDVEYQNLGKNDFSDDLNLKDSQETVLWALVEHPVPLLPNVKLSRTPLTLEGKNGQLKADFGSVQANVPGIDTRIELDQMDAILYYEVLDNWVNVDLGLNFKNIDGSVEVSGHGQRTKESFSATIPMLYANAVFEFPFTNFFAGVEGALLSVGDNSVTDITATVGYESDLGLGALLGLRRQAIVLKDVDNVELDFTVSGPFAAVYYHF